MNPTTYILYSQRLDKYYVGYTSTSLEERLKKHLANHSGFTGKAKDWKVVHAEEYDSASQARSREIEIKKWKSRVRIERLIAST